MAPKLSIAFKAKQKLLQKFQTVNFKKILKLNLPLSTRPSFVVLLIAIIMIIEFKFMTNFSQTLMLLVIVKIDQFAVAHL